MDTNNTNKDLGSVLTHVEALQKQLAAKDNELKECRQREEEARQQATQLSSVNAKLTEAKREVMKEDFNNKVRDWVRGLDPKQVPDTLKDEFLVNCEKFAEKGDDTGVWKVNVLFILFCFQKINTGPTGRLLRVGGAPESGQHDPEAHGGLQHA